MITHRGYTAEQERNHHVWISDSDGAAICHMAYTKKLSDEELRGAIDDFLNMMEQLDDTEPWEE